MLSYKYKWHLSDWLEYRRWKNNKKKKKNYSGVETTTFSIYWDFFIFFHTEYRWIKNILVMMNIRVFLTLSASFSLFICYPRWSDAKLLCSGSLGPHCHWGDGSGLTKAKEVRIKVKTNSTFLLQNKSHSLYILSRIPYSKLKLHILLPRKCSGGWIHFYTAK